MATYFPNRNSTKQKRTNILRNFLRPILRKIAGFAIFIIGVILIGAILYFLAQDIPIWVFGKTVPARVEELWVENVSEPNSNETVFKYFLRYSFQTDDGESFENSKALSDIEWSGQFTGNEIDVVYFPLIPSHNRLDDSRFVYALLCMYIPFIVIGLFALMSGWQMLSLNKTNDSWDTWKNFYVRRFKKS